MFFFYSRYRQYIIWLFSAQIHWLNPLTFVFNYILTVDYFFLEIVSILVQTTDQMSSLPVGFMSVQIPSCWNNLHNSYSWLNGRMLQCCSASICTWILCSLIRAGRAVVALRILNPGVLPLLSRVMNNHFRHYANSQKLSLKKRRPSN